MLRQTDAR